MSNLIAELRQLGQRRVRYTFAGEQVACNLCGSREQDVVSRLDRYFGPLRTVLCRGCGLVFSNPMPTEDELRVFYTSHYRRDYHGSEVPRARAAARASQGAMMRLRTLAPFIEPGARTLDVGAGGGEFVTCMARNGYRAEGLEPNAAYAAYARREYGAAIHDVGWQDADLAAGSMDLITATHVLEHFRDPGEALRRFAQWLSPRGRLFISVPNVQNYHRSPLSRFHFAHLYNFNQHSLCLLAARAGLVPVKTWEDEPTNVLFAVAAGSMPPGQRSEDEQANYRRMRRYFDEQTAWRYYRRLQPYRRILGKLARRVGEHRDTRSLHSARDAVQQSLPEAGTVDSRS
jgi:2-polyprenyl-3-methyl-5-hydroxy-6-metoxy-1,4-benzoquinol methylase